MGVEVETLEDLIPPRCKAVCVRINPAPTSVEVGHYYQGRLGQRFFARLRSVALLPPGVEGFEDDALDDLGSRVTAEATLNTLRAHLAGSNAS